MFHAMWQNIFTVTTTETTEAVTVTVKININSVPIYYYLHTGYKQVNGTKTYWQMQNDVNYHVSSQKLIEWLTSQLIHELSCTEYRQRHL